MEEGVDDLIVLLERARGGDAEVYGEVVERFQDMAVGYGYSVLGDFHLAQDAAQEAFLEAYVQLPRLREMAGFAGLLRRIVFKHCDRLTRRGRGCLILSTAAAVGRASLEVGPVEKLEEEEMKELVRQALESLPEQERAVVSLFYISDHSQNEIAGFLDISVDAVKNRLRAARKRLKERLIGMVEENLSEGKPSKDRQFVEAVRRVMAPQQEKDAEAIYAWLEHKVQRLDMAVQSRKGRIADSHYDWTTARLGLVDDELIAHVGVYEIGLRLGCGQVRVAGINVDYVDPDYSGGRELFDQVIEDAVGAMYTHGYDLSIVRTDSLDVYGRHGYVSTMPFVVRHRVKIEDLPTELPDVQWREVDLDDVHSYPGVAELYNRENEGVSMTALRPTYPHSKCPTVETGKYGPGLLLMDEDDELVGYFADPVGHNAEHTKEISISDSGGDPQQRLRVLGQIARQYKNCESVAFFNLPHDSALARHIRRLVHRVEVGDERCRGQIPMRIVNLNSTLRHMADEFSCRLRRAGHGAWSGALRIVAGDQSACLVVENGCVAVVDEVETADVIEGGQEIVRLLVGTDGADVVVAEAGMRLSGAAEWLARVLFPPLHPVLPNEYL